MSDRTRVLFFCMGNICRSPLAEGVFVQQIRELRLGDRFHVDSAGTDGWHVGEQPHESSIRVARLHGIDIAGQRARKLVAEDIVRFDFLVAMDRSNRDRAAQLGIVERTRLLLLREFDPEATDDLDVPDPWGGSPQDYQHVFDILRRSMPGFIDHARRIGPRTSVA